jgi:hemerythrin-like metal-binding protein
MISAFEGRDTKSAQLSILEEHCLLAGRIDDASKQVDIFFSATAKQSPAEVRRVIVLLEDLLQIAREHFQHEEAEMTMNAFPGLIFHKRDHDYLIKSLMDFTSALSHGTTSFSNDMGVNLRSWLTYHIKKYDDAYVAFIGSERT